MMQRKKFIQTMLAATGALTLGTSLRSLSEILPEQDTVMPVLFVGHGSPMNALEDNDFTRGWKKAVSNLPRPTAILCVSAHWLTRGTYVTAMPQPRTIHDFGGFPQSLFETQYPAPGSPEVARQVAETITSVEVGLDHEEWGLDHGTWSVLKQMYPDADIPVLQLSIDYHRPGEWHYAIANELSALRKKGVLIIGSGNMVHNLRMVDFNRPDTGYDWAIEMNETFKKHILEGNHAPLKDYTTLGRAAMLAVPTPDHYYPLLYVLGLQDNKENVQLFNDQVLMGSLTMTSVIVGA